MFSDPLPQHRWLQNMVGYWRYEMECEIGPDGPGHIMKGTESVRALGGLWTVCEGKGNAPDGTSFSNIMTLGYDPTQERFVGTYVASMMTHLWSYSGQLNDANNVLALESHGPSCTENGVTSKYQDTIEFIDQDRRKMTSQMQNEDGTWTLLMRIHYERLSDLNASEGTP